MYRHHAILNVIHFTNYYSVQYYINCYNYEAGEGESQITATLKLKHFNLR